MNVAAIVSATLLTLAVAIPAAAQQTPRLPAERIRVEEVDDLPRHSYPVLTTATALLQDDVQFAAFAEKLEADLRSDLATYVIEDRATLKSYYDALSDLSLQRGDYAGAVAYQDSMRALEGKPGVRLTTGLVYRALAEAHRASGERVEDTFRDAFRRDVVALPYSEVQAELTSLRANFEVGSPNALISFVHALLEPAAQTGELGREHAQQLVKIRAYADRVAPMREIVIEVLSETIAAHGVVKPDIWAEREVSLIGRADLTPVIIGIWDSGVDVELFAGRLFTNRGEVPGNGRDDDANGYVDDVHGIAHDLDRQPTTGVLFPLTLTQAEVAEYRGYLQGRSDLLAGIDSPEAEAFKQKVTSTPPEQFRAWSEGMNQFALYIHGTHVAGIVMRDNPAARLLVARFTWDYRSLPRIPTVDRAERRAREFSATVEYFKRHGVRVVNMSWGFFALEIESALEVNNAGGSPEERRELARRIFRIQADALRVAMASAPEILFVAAVGNSDLDNRFVEDAPSSFDLPNLVSVAAVDRAGDEAAFTSYGKVDVYANGVHVSSRVPGGESVAWSGTSLAAPQVVNLAAKLLALRPDLTVAELRRAILEAADEKTIGEGKRIRLLYPKASVEKVMGGVTGDGASR